MNKWLKQNVFINKKINKKGDYMDTLKKLPKSFFRKEREKASCDSLNDIKTFKFEDEKKILKGDKELIVTLPKKA